MRLKNTSLTEQAVVEGQRTEGVSGGSALSSKEHRGALGLSLWLLHRYLRDPASDRCQYPSKPCHAFRKFMRLHAPQAASRLSRRIVDSLILPSNFTTHQLVVA